MKISEVEANRICPICCRDALSLHYISKNLQDILKEYFPDLHYCEGVFAGSVSGGCFNYGQ